MVDMLRWDRLDEKARTAALERPEQERTADIESRVAVIIDRVRAEGDDAVIELTSEYDGVRLDRLAVDPSVIAGAADALSQTQVDAIRIARDAIETFHRAQLPVDLAVETSPGVRCERITRPIRSVGLYVPAGSAPLPSTALMLGVPSGLAGCPVRVLVTPPRSDGLPDPAVLHAAALCGIDQVFCAGGTQAVAAMAFGTASVPKVDKIFGPGNRWVTAAKQQVARMPGGAALDMPAGPSEVLVIADAAADPRFVAADLISQAEHGPDSQAVLVSPSLALIRDVDVELASQLASLPRADIARASLRYARLVLTEDLDQAVDVSNRYAPEHLILQVSEPRSLLDRVTCAGSVFLGAWSPEAVGDYCSGTNHVLPTGGHARASSGVSVDAFVNRITVQELSAEGLGNIGPVARTLADMEGLAGHAHAVTLRLDKIARRSVA